MPLPPEKFPESFFRAGLVGTCGHLWTVKAIEHQKHNLNCCVNVLGRKIEERVDKENK